MAIRARLPTTLRSFYTRVPRHLYRPLGAHHGGSSSSANTRFFFPSQLYGDQQQFSLRLLWSPDAKSFASGAQPAHQMLTMPALSPTMDKGNIVSWKKKEGDEVAVGDSLGEIETDKATVDFDSPEEGFVAKILVPPGSKDIPVGQPVIILVESAEDVAKVTANGLAEESRNNTEEKVEKAFDAHESSAPSHEPPTRLGPSVRRLLTESGLDVSLLRGTGPGGIIIKGDVLAAMRAGPKTEKATRPMVSEKSSTNTATQPTLPPKSGSQVSVFSSSELAYEDLPTSQIRKVIAKRLCESKNGIPHLYLSADAFLDKTLKLRKELKEKHGIHVSVNDFVIRAAALALKDVPEANAHWDETAGDIIPGSSIDISIAVATEKGLMTPILRNADQKSLSAISSEVKLLADKARQGKLAPHEFQGGSFSISNLGMFSVDHFCAVINPPQACILAVGRGEQIVIWEEDENGQGKPRSAMKMTLTLSADHRVVNIDLGGRFLQTLSAIFSDPRRILL